ncbi:acyl-CoA--sterol O-acyltransferase 1-like protein [Tanacetum coccineum]|uniref:Acyl-CoA--sterol O-acyltransferase 1-like protein n=1 Tax=Tanacetum coccineum TaxID=301880 RepID=A0ABQ4Z815_9ASTR
MDFKQETKNFIKVVVYASTSLTYCYYIAKLIPKGFTRLLTFLPVVLLFVSIPLFFNSVHLIGAISFLISWLANFKLILFAFGKGPLSPPFISLSHFLSFACFPIGKHKNTTSSHKSSLMSYGLKGLLLVIFLKGYYDYGDQMTPMMGWILLAFSVYFCLEVMLGLSSKIMGLILLEVELDPQFDKPYLSTSLQDFWGRRWNVMVNRVLYPTVYNPVRTLSSRVIGRFWAPIPAILTTFAVSGLMHELIFFYFTRDWPTWDTMLFFCLHGVSLVMEIAIKKSVNNVVKWRLPHDHITTPFVVAFVFATSYWLFYPELMRCQLVERAFEEYGAVINIAKGVISPTLQYITALHDDNKTISLKS